MMLPEQTHSIRIGVFAIPVAGQRTPQISKPHTRRTARCVTLVMVNPLRACNVPIPTSLLPSHNHSLDSTVVNCQ